MARFRAEKARLADVLEKDDWYTRIRMECQSADAATGMINPLVAFLSRPEKRERAAWALGEAAAAVAKEHMEAARVLVRRLMWSLNEESGSLGWGAPEAIGCILARIPALAEEYGGLLLSYARNTGREDNYLDHAPLRAGVFRGAARPAETVPELMARHAPVLVAGVEDADPEVRGMAVLAATVLARHAQSLRREDRERLRAALRGSAETAGESITYFDGREERTDMVRDLAAEAFKILSETGNID